MTRDSWKGGTHCAMCCYHEILWGDPKRVSEVHGLACNGVAPGGFNSLNCESTKRFNPPHQVLTVWNRQGLTLIQAVSGPTTSCGPALMKGLVRARFQPETLLADQGAVPVDTRQIGSENLDMGAKTGQ